MLLGQAGEVAGKIVRAAGEALLAEGQVVVRDDTTVTRRDREVEATHVVAETVAAELEVAEIGSGGDVAGVASAALAVELAGGERPLEHGIGRGSRGEQVAESLGDVVVARSRIEPSFVAASAVRQAWGLLASITREVARAREWMRVVAGARRRVDARAAGIAARVTRSRG